MVDRATRYQNAMNQIQERNKPKPGQQPVEVPDDTYERQVKSVRLFIACLSPLPSSWRSLRRCHNL
jgi:hypothetical protein